MNIIFNCPAPNLDNGSIELLAFRASWSYMSLLQTGGTKEDLFSSTQRSMSTISSPAAMLYAVGYRGREEDRDRQRGGDRLYAREHTSQLTSPAHTSAAAS